MILASTVDARGLAQTPPTIQRRSIFGQSLLALGLRSENGFETKD
jgi:hypothetical protein